MCRSQKETRRKCRREKGRRDESVGGEREIREREKKGGIRGFR